MQHSTSKATTLLSPSVAEDREELSGSDAQETSAAGSGCRRESIRGSFGGQIHMVVNGRRIKAIIRDASFSNDPNTIGVGILHHDLIPLERQVPCKIVHTESLPDEASLVLKWSRSFGSRGLLSGGQLLCNDEGRPADDGS